MDTEDALDVSFPRLFTANIYYGPFGNLREGLFISFIFSNATGCQGVITNYKQYGELLEGLYPLKLCRKSNVDDNKLSLGDGKDKDKNKVKNKVKDKNKDNNKNASSSKSDVDAKLKGVKKIHVNSDWGKSKDKDKAKDKDKDKDENAGFSESDIDAKLETGKKSHVDADWNKKLDLSETSIVKPSQS